MPALLTRLGRSRVAGILTVGLGLAAIAVVMFAPLYSSMSVECSGSTGAELVCHTASKTSQSAIPIQPRTALFLAVMAALVTAVGLTVAVNGRTARLTRTVLTGGTVLLWGGIALSMASIGWFFVPAGVAAIVAVVSSAGGSPPTGSDPPA